MNPNAKEFVFSAAAPAWTPSFSMPPKSEAVVPPVPPEPVVEKISEIPPESDADADADDGEEPIDDNDPLWIATLKLCNGDKEAALRRLEDPDSLMKIPEIRAIMEAGEGAETTEEWEQQPESCETPVEVKSPEGKSAGLVIVEEEEPTEEIVIQEGDPREHLNLVFIGHVDAGKSTLSGSILYAMGKVDQRTIERFEREAKQRNRESWFLAFIMDTSEEERAKGKTVEVGRAHFETDIHRYTLMDAPGHKNYVPNMIAGAAQADVGVLVISARKGEFETGFEKGGQTREHALLAKTLGVQYLIVVVNKMDDPTVEWDQGRYEECVSKLKPFLKSCGYVIKKDVRFLPISGLSGDNILREVSAEKCPWWRTMVNTAAHNTTTPTLLSTLDSFSITGRDADAPLRIPCLDRYLEGRCMVMGKIESGTLRLGEEVAVAPTKKRAKVEAIQIGDTFVASAKPGENVLIKFSLNVEDIQKGYVLSSPSNICSAVTVIKVQMALVDMLEHRPIFSPGYEAVMHVHTIEIEVNCFELVSVLDKGKQLKRPFARQGQQCVAKLTMPISTCMETFATLPAMGRFTLRDEGKTIAIGKIVELLK